VGNIYAEIKYKMEILNNFKTKIKKDGIVGYFTYAFGWLAFEMQVWLHNKYYILSSKIFKKRIVHVVGDSHTQVFRHVPFFVIHYLGAATAHNLIKEKNTTGSREKIFKLLGRIKKRDIILLSFGEIDCRSQIYKQSKNQNRPITDLINKTIENYELAITQLKKIHPNLNIYSIAPAEKKGDPYNKSIPADIQAKIKSEFNKKLEQMCRRNKLFFVNIYPDTINKQGHLATKYSGKDGVHYNELVCTLVLKKINKNVAK
jgi:lysophospholipase L1-like esterase